MLGFFARLFRIAPLPKRSFGFDIPREFVLRLAGVPGRTPKAAPSAG